MCVFSMLQLGLVWLWACGCPADILSSLGTLGELSPLLTIVLCNVASVTSQCFVNPAVMML